MKFGFCSLFVLMTVGIHAQTVPVGTGSKVKQEDAQSSLDFHNKKRKDVGLSTLKWSTALASYAQAWADNLATNGCSLKHRPQSGAWAQKYGENIYFATGPNVNVLDASKAWYDEIKDFNNGKLTLSNIAKVGHYTQMVWRSTTEVGFGIAKCPSGATIVVANYNPRGNYLGEKPY